MATENRGVMVYLPLELEEKVVEFCTDRKIVRKDKDGNIVPSLGSGIVAYLKSQLLIDLPSARRRQLASTGITKEDVLKLIVESNTSNVLSSKLADEELVHRLETIEQSLSSSVGLERDEVETLIQESEREIMQTVRNLWVELSGELTAIKVIEQVKSPQSSISTIGKRKATVDDSALNDSTPSVKTLKRDRSLSYVTRFREMAQNWSAEDIVKIKEIAFSTDKKFLSRDRLMQLTNFGVGVPAESEDMPCTSYSHKEFSRIGRALKIVFDELVGVSVAAP